MGRCLIVPFRIMKRRLQPALQCELKSAFRWFVGKPPSFWKCSPIHLSKSCRGLYPLHLVQAIHRHRVRHTSRLCLRLRGFHHPRFQWLTGLEDEYGTGKSQRRVRRRELAISCNSRSSSSRSLSDVLEGDIFHIQICELLQDVFGFVHIFFIEREVYSEEKILRDDDFDGFP